MKHQFASDNYSGICPQALEAMIEANHDHELPYGEDAWTTKACDMIRDLFETDCEVFFVFNGTAANSLALASMGQSYHSIICHDTAHVETDECGATQFFSNGTKLLLARGENGKISLEDVEYVAKKRNDIHYPKPRVLSLTQATELGTVYSVDEVRAAGKLARELGLHVHMDGARFSNAVASVGATPAELSWKSGVDVLCFGGIKNGMSSGEAVVFFDHDLACEFEYRCKQAGQLASKMRFMAAQWTGMISSGAWIENAKHSNRMACLLEKELRSIDGVRILFPRQANSVFVDLPGGVSEALQRKGWHFYNFIGDGGARFMCSWDTKKEDLDSLVADIKNS